MKQMSGGIKNNYYKILGLKHNANSDEIKKRYRALAKQYHPDAKAGDENIFKRIKEAYEELSDPYKRALHNIALFSGSLSDIKEKNCLKCRGKGHWVSKVLYGNNKVNSKIICTLCKGTGIINIENNG